MSEWKRVIAHVDMDSFYASVEVRDNPSLRGKPIAVGGDARRRGVVSSASYEARKFGVRSAMPMATALRMCPDLIVVPGRMSKYVDASRTLRGVFREFSPLVEPISLDEAFLDLTGAQRLLGAVREIGEAIRRRISEELRLTASVGISSSKFVAKLASDHEKPDGLTIVPPDDVVSFVQSLPLERLWGVGPATLERLRREGIRSIRALAHADPDRLERALGKYARRLVQLARGKDDRPVAPDAPMKSVSHEVTFAQDQSDEGVLEGVLLGLAEKVARRARSKDVSGRTITLKLRRPDFTTLTRSHTLASPTNETGVIFRNVRSLFHSVPRGGEAVRLLGVGLSNLTECLQLELDLFGEGQFQEEEGAEGEKRRHLQEAEDAIIKRFGTGALARAGTLLRSRAEDTASLPDRSRPDEDF
jgi:DNA polymerase-4